LKTLKFNNFQIQISWSNEGKSAASFCLQVSISPTFYEQLLRQIPFTKKLQIYNYNFLAKGIWHKSCSKNVGEIDTRWQHGSRAYFATFIFQKITKLLKKLNNCYS
jgi:hypothetical protein